MNSASKNLAEEIDNLSLMLVVAEGTDENSLKDAMLVFENIEKLTSTNELPRDLIGQLVELLDQVKQTTNDLKYEALKNLASSAQAMLNGYPFDNSLEDSTDFSEVKNVDEGRGETEASSNEILSSFYSTHQELMKDIFEKFSNIQKIPGSNSLPHELHQEVETYALRLNQDANQISCKPLSEMAQTLFTLLMQYELVDINKELQLIGGYILDVFQKSQNNQADSITAIPGNIAEALKTIENKLSGTFNTVEIEASPAENTQSEPSRNQSETEAQSQTLSSYTVDADSEILSEFVAEAQDHLNAVEAVLLERELDFSAEDVDTLFRGVHSLKGTSSYFNLMEINESSHLLENILDEVRKGIRVLDIRLKSLVLRYVDIQNNLLKSAQESMSNGGLIQRSRSVQDFIKDIEDFFNNKFDSSLASISEASAETVEVENPVVPNSVEQSEIIAKQEFNDSTNVTEESQSQKSSNQKENVTSKSFVKIDTERLDSLGEMIGEMVIYSSMLIRRCRVMLSNDESMMRMSDQVEKFSRELQDIGMSMRLDPIKGLFQKLSRLVWDTSKKLGKEVKFVVKGEDTELDRNVIERLADPLMHMVRNSLDHGIEDPETRVAIGKDKYGLIELSSSHEGGSIVIKIKDDGRGLDPAKLLSKAIEKGIVSKDVNLSEQEIFQLIFAPGFSTAEKVTNISGRGVGMDVVRTNIEAMRGRIQIESKLGEGSVFSIELPLTLAIIEGIEATVGKEKFIFPMLSVVELVRPTLAMIGSSMHVDETFIFRGKHLPLFRLTNIFSVPSHLTCPSEGRVIILNNGGELVALLVDEIGGNCQTVIKNLGPLFEKQSGIAGCAIVNNGDIGLIIDVRSLVQVAKSESKSKTSFNKSVSSNAGI